MPESIVLPGTFDCAQYFAPPQSRTVANGSRRARLESAATGAENQHDSEPSHSISIVFGRSLNQRVVGSSPTRFTNISKDLHPAQEVKVQRGCFARIEFPSSDSIKKQTSP